jgi:DNA uptake protein ComE-like DNA-binding protein
MLFPDEKILLTLNSGKVNEIKKLQTIGGKKADVVIQWTSLNGPLQSVGVFKKCVLETMG